MHVLPGFFFSHTLLENPRVRSARKKMSDDMNINPALPVVFYRKRDQKNDERFVRCEQLMAELDQLPPSIGAFIQKWDVTCVARPKHITHVPTIQVDRTLFVGDQAFAWLQGFACCFSITVDNCAGGVCRVPTATQPAPAAHDTHPHQTRIVTSGSGSGSADIGGVRLALDRPSGGAPSGYVRGPPKHGPVSIDEPRGPTPEEKARIMAAEARIKEARTQSTK